MSSISEVLRRFGSESAADLKVQVMTDRMEERRELIYNARSEYSELKLSVKELREAIYQYDSGNPAYPFTVVRAELAKFYDLLEKL